MVLRLITVVGGRISTLAQMLDHYIGLGVDSVSVYVHTTDLNMAVVDEAAAIARERGIKIAGHIVGEWPEVQYRLINQIASLCSDEWYLIADQDEFHEYRSEVRNILAECSDRGFTYLRGCFVDRLSRDRSLAELDKERAIADQFPIGAFFTFPVLGGNPMKVVAAKGGTIMTNYGHHRALNGNACPIGLHFIQVNHYKWTADLLSYLATRSANLLDRHATRREDQRFASYYRWHNNAFDVEDPGVLAGWCLPEYPHWNVVTSICAMLDTKRWSGQHYGEADAGNKRVRLLP